MSQYAEAQSDANRQIIEFLIKRIERLEQEVLRIQKRDGIAGMTYEFETWIKTFDLKPKPEKE